MRNRQPTVSVQPIEDGAFSPQAALCRALWDLLIALLGLLWRVSVRLLALAVIVAGYAVMFFAFLLIFAVLFSLMG
ncbi:MAG: hypothetical protein C7B46_06990 [Sulfobacillus benefaciens]|uniref:Uncharacterized protein n=1 Tax=Sulfobacillus benefaciens TaxID=453960 RepID=A0A2T2XHY6_9FIRM|nr:MAG: hypothetical protein C7B46_06990 [Sulfobacillus benefaciens]